MSHRPFDIHVHGEVSLRIDVKPPQIEEALKPLLDYVGAADLSSASASAYEEEPGIQWDQRDHVLSLCWTISGDDDFRQAVQDMCMGLNDLAATGAALEVTFYDTDFDEEGASDGDEARDDFLMCFVGPTPAAILQVQRDMMVDDLVQMMERHFDAAELGGVVAAVDALFEQRYKALVDATQWGGPTRGFGGGGGHGGGRKPRHLH